MALKAPFFKNLKALLQNLLAVSKINSDLRKSYENLGRLLVPYFDHSNTHNKVDQEDQEDHKEYVNFLLKKIKKQENELKKLESHVQSIKS